jgi:hypothetical protein
MLVLQIPIPSSHSVDAPFFPLFLILRKGSGGEVDLGRVTHVFIVSEKNQRKHMKTSP